MPSNQQYLYFNKYNVELKKFYKDYTTICAFDEKQQKDFIIDQVELANKLLKKIFKANQNDFLDERLRYLLLGSFIELIMKISLVKYNWSNVRVVYGQYSFEEAKNHLVNSLKNKGLTNEQVKRVREVLENIQIQRNQTIHGPAKMYYHYAVPIQIVQIVLLLNILFELGLEETELRKTQKTYAVQQGMNFKDVGILSLIN